MANVNMLKILSANCQGIRDKRKCYDVINYMKESYPNIICIQDTHLLKDEADEMRTLSDCECYLSGFSTNSRGVAVLNSDNFECKIVNSEIDENGNYVCLDLELQSFSVRLINIYAPNNDKPAFFDHIRNLVKDNIQSYVIICGDFNLVLDFDKDCHNYVNINNPKSRQHWLETMEIHDLRDVFRYFHPDLRRYTWRRKHPIKQARLDYFINELFIDLITNCKIKPGYRSDHSIVELTVTVNSFRQGKGIWKLNCELLKNPDYITAVNKTIQAVREKYAIPVYKRDYINENNDTFIQFTIDDDLLLEMMLLEIRGISLQFSSFLKKSKDLREKELIKLIEKSENSESNKDFNENVDAMKLELQEIRESKLRGHIVHSRAHWLQYGEKPSRYFCSLERKNYIEKTIRKLHKANGEVITHQAGILSEIRSFYTDLYRSRDHLLSDIDLHEHFKNENINKLDGNESLNLGKLLTVDELGYTLKNMKNNKTPGIDGFPAEFLKIFWCKLKTIITRALNHCFQKGQLSISLRHAIINCIPKGNKPREFLQNWRPISLLSVLYKLLSGTIANRTKPFLNKLISETQTGFIPGRYIGESTRLVYDTMQYLEANSKPGLLMLIDFEKAFDSISWKFMYNVLNFLGFPSDYVLWIKLLNANFTASIVQAGVKSETVSIERGCKQGDPIASYLFIFCGQILSYLLQFEKNFTGITIKEKELKLSQFADDTTLFLDGSQNSLQAALNTIEIFGSYSGLKMNKNKTKAIWIGKRKHSIDKLSVNAPLDWGTTQFDLLGIRFSVDLQEMTNLNYSLALEKSEKLLHSWKKRAVTPLGKITVIKTFIISKFAHLFTCIPSPDVHFIKTLNTLLFCYLWNGKPDKIKRKWITQDYDYGGLRMINLNCFIQSLKLTWMARLLKQGSSLWINVFEQTISPIDKLIKLGPQWCQCLCNSISNKFWVDVFNNWVTF